MLHIQAYTGTNIYRHIHAQTYIYTNIYRHIQAREEAQALPYIYMYIHIHIYTHTHIYINTYIRRHDTRRGSGLAQTHIPNKYIYTYTHT